MEPAYPCVCCGYRTLLDPPGSHEICPVCGWEDDVYQLRWPYQAVGANDRSLFDAQRSFIPPASSPGSSRRQTRADVADVERDPLWRRIDDRRDRFEPRGGSLAPWPEIGRSCTGGGAAPREPGGRTSHPVPSPTATTPTVGPPSSPLPCMLSPTRRPLPILTTSPAWRSTSTTTSGAADRSAR